MPVEVSRVWFTGIGGTADRRPRHGHPYWARGTGHAGAPAERVAMGQVHQGLGLRAGNDQEVAWMVPVFCPEVQEAIGY